MSATPRHRAAGSLRVLLALLLTFSQAVSSPAAYALKVQAPTQSAAAVGLEEGLRGGPSAREHYIHTLEQVVVADRLAMTVIPNHGAPASRVAIAEPDDETTFMSRGSEAKSGGQRLRLVDLATGRSQPIVAPGVDNPKALTYHNDVLYVAQSEGRVHRFEVPHNQWLPAWTLKYEVADSDATGGRRSVRLAHPGGVAVDGRRRILYVTDSEAGRIVGFRLSDGAFTGFLVTGLRAPEDVVVGPHPTDPTKTALYVADRLRSTVLAYDSKTGVPLAFSIPNLANPAKLAIDPEHRLLFVVSGHAGFLGGFSLDTGAKVELEIPKTDAVRRYYEKHVADIEVDLAQAADVVYDPHTKAIILATHQRLIPFWVDGQSLRLTPPATGLEESSEKAEDLRALRDLLEPEGRVFNGSDEVRWLSPRLIASVAKTDDGKVRLSLQGVGRRVLNHLADTRITMKRVEDKRPGVTEKLESPRSFDEMSSEVTATFPQDDSASVSYQFRLAKTGAEEPPPHLSLARPGLEEIAQIGAKVREAQAMGVLVFDETQQAVAGGMTLLRAKAVPELPLRVVDDIVFTAGEQLAAPAAEQGIPLAIGTVRMRHQALRALEAPWVQILVSPGWFDWSEAIWRMAWERGKLFMPGVGSVKEARQVIVVADRIGIPHDQIYLKAFPALYQGREGFINEVLGPLRVTRAEFNAWVEIVYDDEQSGLPLATYTALAEHFKNPGGGKKTFRVPVRDDEWFDGRSLVRQIAEKYPHIHLIPTSGRFTPEHVHWVGRGNHVDAIGLLIRANQAGPDSAEVRAPRIAAVRRTPVAADALQVWIVDNQRDWLDATAIKVRQMARALPQGRGFNSEAQIRQFQDSQAMITALQSAEGRDPDLVLTDLSMPGHLDGFAVAEAVRHHHPNTYIVLITSYSLRQKPEIAQAMAEGRLTGYLEKPVEWTDPEFHAAITRLLTNLLAPAGLEERVLQGPKNPITTVRFISGGTSLIAVDEGLQLVSTWKLGRGTSVRATPTYFLKPPEGKSPNASVAAISADGEVIACGDRGVSGPAGGQTVTRGAIWLHRYELTASRWRTPARVFGPVTRLAVDGARRFAAATAGNSNPGIQLVSETTRGRSKGVEAKVTALAFDAAGTSLVAGTETGVLYVWRVPDDAVELDEPAWQQRVEGAIHSVAFAPDGRVFTGLAAGRVQVWSAEGQPQRMLRGPAAPVTTLAVRRDGTIYAGVGPGVWQWGPDAVQGERAITDRPGPVRQLVLSPDSNTLAVVVDQHVHLISLPPLPVALQVAAGGASLLPATGLEEPLQRQAAAVAALETLQRVAGAARVTAPTDRFYFLRDGAVALAPAFERLGLRFLVRADTMVAAGALLDLGVPADRIAGATSPELPAGWYSRLKITRVANAAWGDRRFLEAVRRPMDPWTVTSVLTVRQIPDSDAAWVSFWRDWPLPDAVRAQLSPVVKATEDYFQAMG